ncbi:MAG: FecR family protein [Verrucomicrobiota bacterium]
MKLSSRIVFWFQTLIVIGCFSALQAQTTPGTYVATGVKGSVSWVHPKSKAQAPLTNGQKLPQGAIITTGADSSAVLVFSNGATATLQADTTIEVAKFAQQSFAPEALLDESLEPSISSTELNIIKGELVGEVRKLRTGSDFTVNSPVGAAGVRGTKFAVKYDPVTNTLSIQTSVGLVVFIPEVGAGGELSIGAEQQITVEDGVAGGVEALTESQRDAINAVVQAAVEAVNEVLSEPAAPDAPPVIETPITVPNVDEISGSNP